MAEIIKRDESILTESEKGVLYRTLEKMEEYFPEHKVYAFDALCSQHRKTSSTFSKKLGYDSVEDFLNAYGFEIISGEAVYEMRKNCGIEPGKEPALLKARIDSAIESLDIYYPDHIVDTGIQKEHKGLAMNLTGYYQWLGYKSLGDMLNAYGFTYSLNKNAAKGGRPSTVNPSSVIEELKKRYPEGTTMKAGEIKEANPDLKIKSVMNKAKELFGMTFADYLIEQGIIIGPKKKTAEEIAAETKAYYEESLKGFDILIQKALLGWKPLPMSADMLFEEFKLSKAISKKRYNNALKELDIDEETHLRELGVLADNSTDNELRELIQRIDFSSL